VRSLAFPLLPPTWLPPDARRWPSREVRPAPAATAPEPRPWPLREKGVRAFPSP
jgi:hypothetical protein